MLFTIRLPDWKHSLVLPIPLFLFDDIVSFAFSITSLVGRTMNKKLFNEMTLKELVNTLESAWYSIRRAGAYTLVDVNSDDGTRISIKMI